MAKWMLMMFKKFKINISSFIIKMQISDHLQVLAKRRYNLKYISNRQFQLTFINKYQGIFLLILA